MGLDKLSKFATDVGNVTSAFAPVVKPLTTLAGLGIGIAQNRKSKRLSGEADALTPSPEDPETRNLLNKIRRKGRAIETGTDPVTSAGRKIISKNLATTQGNITRRSAGDSRMALEGFRRSSKDAGDAAAKLTASTYPAARFYTQLGTDIQSRISSRKFDLLMSRKAQKLREAAEAKSASNRNIAGSLGFGLPS